MSSIWEMNNGDFITTEQQLKQLNKEFEVQQMYQVQVGITAGQDKEIVEEKVEEEKEAELSGEDEFEKIE